MALAPGVVTCMTRGTNQVIEPRYLTCLCAQPLLSRAGGYVVLVLLLSSF